MLLVSSCLLGYAVAREQPYASVIGGLGGAGAGGPGAGTASPRMLGTRDLVAPLTLSTIPLGRVNVVATKFMASVSSDATVRPAPRAWSCGFLEVFTTCCMYVKCLWL